MAGIITSALFDIGEGDKHDRGMMEAQSDGNLYTCTPWYGKNWWER